MPLLLGANVVRFERRFEDGFRLDLDRVAAALTPRTRLIIVTNPHNPTGVLTGPRRRCVHSATLAERHGCYVLADEIYLDAVPGPPPAVAATLSPRIVTTSSLTKAYGLAGLRCGWALADAALCEEIRRARDLVDGSGSVLAERAAAVAFDHLPALAARAGAILAPNFARFERVHGRASPALEWVVPRGRNRGVPATARDGVRRRVRRPAAPRLRDGRRARDGSSRRRPTSAWRWGSPRDVLERGLEAIAARARSREATRVRRWRLGPGAEQAGRQEQRRRAAG